MHLVLNADVYAPRALGMRHLLVVGEQIAWMGEEVPSLPASWEVETTDLEGRRLIPGLVDAHVHPTGGGGEDGFASRMAPVGAEAFLRGATTTVVGVLGTDDVTRSTAGLVATVRALAAEGMSAWCLTGGYHVPPTTLTGSVKDDIVHVDPILGVGEIAISDHRSSQPTADELRRVAADAHLAGMLAGKAGVVQIHVGGGPRGLAPLLEALDGSELPAKVFHPTHVGRSEALFDEALAHVRRGGAIDLTVPQVPASSTPRLATLFERYAAAELPPARLTVSSDAGGSLPRFDAEGRVTGMAVGAPEALGRALAGLLAAGVPPEHALPPFTVNPARLYRLERKGRIAVGCDADLAVLDESGPPVLLMVRGRRHHT